MIDSTRLGNRTVRMPGFPPGEWLGTDAPIDRGQLYGHVTLIDFWEYTCSNCIRTLPYLQHWDARYREAGLRVIGVHTPEFKFSGLRAAVEMAMSHFEIPYPVLLDKDARAWDSFAVKAWPTKLIVDPGGYIRYRQSGEGGYGETEAAIQEALGLLNPDANFPPLLDVLAPEDAAGAVCYRTTPELFTGYERGSLGNPEGYAAEGPLLYQLPLALARTEPHFYADGFWRAGPEGFTFAGQHGGMLILPYHAAGVNAVLSPTPDPVELLLDLWPGDAPPRVEVWLDDRPLWREEAGADVQFDEDGVAYVDVTEPRMYALVQRAEHGYHELELRFHTGGVTVYSFTFNRCVAPGAGPGDPDVFEIG